MTKLIRATGWTLIGSGVVILLYLVYLMFFTNLTTDQAQQDLLEEWRLEVGAAPDTRSDAPRADTSEERAPVDPGDAYAVLWFERPGSDAPLVHEDPLYVVEGVTLDVLRRGPGHYPQTAGPGEPGNFGLSGHRTTYGAPFYDLDDLQPGDEVHVVDRDGVEWIYIVDSQRVVRPTDTWVIGDDPLGTGEPTLTLTTCHPRFSARERLIVFATLAGPAAPVGDASPRADALSPHRTEDV